MPQTLKKMMKKQLLKYGETLNKGDACKILNRSRFYLEKLIDTNQVKINADGQILTRSLQQFAETSPEHKRHMRKQAQKQNQAPSPTA